MTVPLPTVPDFTVPGFTPLGDAALNVRTALARELLAELTARPPRGMQEAVPALEVLTVLFDPLQTTAGELEETLRGRLAGLSAGVRKGARTRVLPVTFGGPDLAWCAEHAGLDETALIRAVCAAPLEVAFLGFTPGFAFLSGLPPALQMPRLSAPREHVPAGSFALGGPWAGVYPRATPGGWRIVGRTALELFDLTRPEPVWWRAGDRVRVQAVAQPWS